YEYPFEVFWRHDSYPYHKGASVLRMLQHSLGDELFWQCVRTYLERYAWQQVETDDLRKVVDDLSGRSYERFFRQWVYRPGVPHLSIDYAWDDDRNELRITCEQTQPITRDSPAFVAELGVWLVAEDGAIEKRVLPIGQRVAAMTVPRDHEPLQVCIDPEAVLLAKIELNLPRPMLVREARQAPTVPARLYAIRALAQIDSDPARRALQEVMLDEQEYWGTRAEAAESLGSMQQQAARDMLAEALADSSTLREHRVRRAAVSALGTYRDTIAAETLLRYAEADVSYGVEAAATSGLGNQTPADAIIERLVANTAKASYRDRIRTAAIQALAELRAPQGLEPARQLAAYGAPYRSRATGIRALATLARNTDSAADVCDFLVGLLADSQEAAVDAAIDALAVLADKGAIRPLQTVVDSSASKERRDRARKAIDTINQESGEADVIRALRERIDKLEDQRKGIEKRLLILEEKRP
ncbi:MAG: HEAT repeat domain-containing protein, partial [Phycisphaerae bacterium]|nr:HEAT repeat domain-containing protein [Phycisphaerae bacterium]